MILNDIELFVFDFDGVLTNNIVYLDQNGIESVACSRSDGLAFDVLRKLNKKTLILSTESNFVVESRAKKLKTPLLQGVSDKVKALKELSIEEGFNLEKVFYVGNDINDYKVMQLCGYTACPNDSHPMIKRISQHVLSVNGGCGVVRALLDDLFELDFIEILY
jgi:3-deoxy-D-manno-octulosonate 8-phosphate phosphatase (KDO 8-P phosphatase)